MLVQKDENDKLLLSINLYVVCLPECLMNLFNFIICGVTDKIVITSFSVNKLVDQGL